MAPSLPPRPHGLRPRTLPAAPRLDGLVAAVDTVRALELGTAPPRQLADEVVVLFSVVSRLHAMALARLASVDAHGVAALESGSSTASWLRHHTGLPSGQASDLVRASRTLRSSLPATESALQDGEITVHHARTIARTARLVEDQLGSSAADSAYAADAVVADVERVMLDVGRSVDAGSLAGFATRVRQVVDPDGALADANRAHERRWLGAATTLDGMVSIDGLLDAEAGALVLTAFASAAAPRGPDDRRSAGQRRADALVDVCAYALDTGHAAATASVRPHLLVTTPLAAVTGDRTTAASAETAEVAWTGPLTDTAVRRLACDAEITRVVVDPPSQPLDVGRATRTVPSPLRNALIVRDRGCVAEGCDRPPAWTEAHHVVHWAEGGSTSLDNLVLLCRTHHRKVHDAGWEFCRIGGTWRLVPPYQDRLGHPVPASLSADAGAHPRAHQVGDPGSGPTEHQLPGPGEEPGADGDP
jgi:hypothetical protein